jgi:hypothetical protein
MHVMARHGPHAVVDPQFGESSVGPAVSDDRDWHVDSPGLTFEVENHLLECPCLRDHVVDGLERHVVLSEPRLEFADVRL